MASQTWKISITSGLNTDGESVVPSLIQQEISGCKGSQCDAGYSYNLIAAITCGQLQMHT